MPPKWSLEAPVAPKIVFGGPWFRPKYNIELRPIHNIEVDTSKKNEIRKDAHETNHRDWSGWNPLNSSGVPFGDERASAYPWIFMDIHGHPSMDIHRYP